MNTYTTNNKKILNRWAHFLGAMLALALLVSTITVSQTLPPLGTAGSFRILAGSAITIGSGCTVTGDVGLSPAAGSFITKAGSVIGTIYAVDATGPASSVSNPTLVNGAKVDLIAAYDNAGGQTPETTVLAELGGQNLVAGIYIPTSGTFGITGTLTLTGTASSIFIFKTGALTTGSGCVVTMAGGALASNVFWYVSSSATINGDFKGNILALTSITQTSGTVDGRLLARNGFVTVNGTTVLPVELVAFTATANQMNANLKWSTATEVNNNGFDVERKSLANWNKVGFVEGAGTTNAPKEYSFTDNNLSTGNYSYRLKQIDRDGKFTYSQSVEVKIGQAPKEFALLQNYPNPFNPTTMISYQLPVSNTVSLKVFDAIGREVATLVNETKEAGSYSVNFDASKLSSGVYVYRLESGSFVSTKKLTLLK